MGRAHRKNRNTERVRDEVNGRVEKMLACILNQSNKKCKGCGDVDVCSLLMKAVVVCKSQACTRERDW
jgi:hypothetical protein